MQPPASSQTRKAEMPKQLRPAGFAVVRHPLLPHATVFGDLLTDDLQNESGVDEQYRQVVALASRPLILEALRLASPSLVASLQASLQEDADISHRSAYALTRYLSRMATRPTPFGLFASFSVVPVSDILNLTMSEDSQLRVHSRADMEVVRSLAKWLEEQPTVRQRLRFFPNTTLFLLGSSAHIVEKTTQRNSSSYRLSAIDISAELQFLLLKSKEGKELQELTRLLAEEFSDISLNDASDFLEELVSAQVLVSELEPELTLTDPLDKLIEVLERLQVHEGVLTNLISIRQACSECSNVPLDQIPAFFSKIYGELSTLPVPTNPGHQLQIDLRREATGVSLAKELVDEVCHALELLNELRPIPVTVLESFRTDFRKRYDHRLVPLLEVLDPEIGLGLVAEERPTAARSNKWVTFLLEKLEQARRTNRDEIVLVEADTLRWRDSPVNKPPSFPDTTIVRIAVYPEKGDELNVLLLNAGGPSALPMLGRFCTLDGPLHAKAIELTEFEQDRAGSVLQAEILHLPMDRTGNVLRRPSLREFEIPVFAASNLQSNKQLALQDLLVGVSDGRVKIFSKSLGVEVMPRLASAHTFNHPKNFSIYQFLAQIQLQGYAIGARWDWGALEGQLYLPRVRFGRVVVSRARWLLYQPDIQRIVDSHVGPESELQLLRTERRIPRFVAIADSDQELVADLHSQLSIKALIQVLRGRKTAVLYEAPLGASLARDGDAFAFANEFVVPLVSNESSNRSNTKTHVHAVWHEGTQSRVAYPGSSCLFLKAYFGPANAERWLKLVLPPILKELRTIVGMEKWFFVRYSDPEYHLRVRFFANESRLWSDGVRIISKYLSADAGPKPWKVSFDTYAPELERYGGRTAISVVEDIFRYDSEAALSILSCDELTTKFPSSLLAFASVDGLLSSFDEALKDVPSLMEVYSRPAKAERIEWDRSYRQVKSQIEDISQGRSPEAKRLRDCFELRRLAIAPLVNQLCHLNNTSALSSDLSQIVLSLLHMSINRFVIDAAAVERRLYYYIAKYQKSRSVRVREEAKRVGLTGNSDA